MKKPAIRRALRPAFSTATALAVVASTPIASPTPAFAQSTAVSEPAENQCPAPSYYTPAEERPSFTFTVSPSEQQRLLQVIDFVIGRETPDGVFRERTLQSINEFRHLYYGSQGRSVTFAQSLTASELEDLRRFSAQVTADKRRYGLTVTAATALRFAAHGTGIDHAELVTATNHGRRAFDGTHAQWLYLVKTQGAKYGLGYFADQIELRNNPDGSVDVRMAEPEALKMLVDLRTHPRINIIMQAERIKNRASLPARLSYRTNLTPGVNMPADVFAVQGQLQMLGFNVGGIDGQPAAMTEAALTSYRRLYGPLLPTGANPDDYLKRFADLARADALEYSVPTTAAAAIRLASLRTGADFGYMMELSSAESRFDHEIQASTSSATGLYQFTEDTWLQTINRYGHKYGMNQLADQMENTFDMNGLLVGRVENPFIRTSAFSLRSDAHLAALMSAEFQLRNKFLIECAVGRPTNRTELYLAHFLGARGAGQFLLRMRDNPSGNAARVFPQAAEANRAVFYNRTKRGRVARSFQEVYNFFDRKFDRNAYEDAGTMAQVGLGQLRVTAAPATPRPASPAPRQP